MKKIILYFCFLAIYGCAGYEPLFSTKNISYYLIDIENISKNNLTEKISKRLNNYKTKGNNKSTSTFKLIAVLSFNFCSDINNTYAIVIFFYLVKYHCLPFFLVVLLLNYHSFLL